MDCREWFLEYARKWYGADPGGEAAGLFADCCAAAVKRGNSIAPLDDFAEETGRTGWVDWFTLRSMLPGMRVDWEVRNAVQRYQDEEWERQWEELEFGED